MSDGPDPLRRRRLACLITMLVGAAVLAVSLRIAPGDALFYPATLALAAVWVIGALASGPVRLGRSARTGCRPVLAGVLLGLALAAVFVLGAFLVRAVPVLQEHVRDVIGFAQHGSIALVLVITLVNGMAEEVFFRGALYDAAPRHPILLTTIVNVAVVAASGNPMLVLAAVLLALVAGWQRRVTGGVLAPIVIHLIWASVMLVALPAVLG
ncbi:type II CAAX prenyl endopeptidase Rce1 family protein [Pseudactinotalea sp.]|uniref:CPBP family glutamic-type intramembrane protease n=1 Tax=Pseudactinotalea sp. TaxID=1926260 RepID=UPI003B3ABCF2